MSKSNIYIILYKIYLLIGWLTLLNPDRSTWSLIVFSKDHANRRRHTPLITGALATHETNVSSCCSDFLLSGRGRVRRGFQSFAAQVHILQLELPAPMLDYMFCSGLAQLAQLSITNPPQDTTVVEGGNAWARRTGWE